MSKVITFSRTFMEEHPRRGQPTFFVEKILFGLWCDFVNREYLEKLIKLNADKIESGKLTEEDLIQFQKSLSCAPPHSPLTKGHTIRIGNRFQAGEKFTPAVWSRKPYAYAQIRFWDDLKIENTWDFEIEIEDRCARMFINDYAFYEQERAYIAQLKTLKTLANNDGLDIEDFRQWFNKPFAGQIICWDKDIQYQNT